MCFAASAVFVPFAGLLVSGRTAALQHLVGELGGGALIRIRLILR